MIDITVLVAPCEFVGKVWYPGKTSVSVLPKYFVMSEISTPTPSAFFDLLDDISDAGNCIVVRGKPTPGDGLRNRSHCGKNATLVQSAQRWVALDIDAAHLPDTGPENLRANLPGSFKNSACWWQRTASSGIKPGTRIRFFFVTDSPICDEDWKIYFKGNTLGIDLCLFIPSQPHFMSRPHFQSGCTDPYTSQSSERRGRLKDSATVSGERRGRLKGLPFVHSGSVIQRVQLLKSQVKQRAQRRPPTSADTATLYRYYLASVSGCLDDMRRAACGEKQLVLVAKAARIVSLALGVGMNPTGDLRALRSVAVADRPDRAHEIDRGIKWAVECVDEPAYPEDKI